MASGTKVRPTVDCPRRDHLQPSPRRVEAVILQIEDAVLSGRLQPGARLPPERQLAEQFRISRSAEREALRALEALGVLAARRGSEARSGSYVEAAS